jgi:hypothetical protein
VSGELDANRAGHMTVGQRFKLLRGVAVLLFASGIGLIVSVAIGPNLVEAFQQDLILGVFATLFFLMCLALGLGCGYGAAADMADVVIGSVRSATGEPKLTREAITTFVPTRPIPIPITYPGQYKYELEVAAHEFTMDRTAGDLLLRHGGRIRVYYAAYSGELLTIDLLAAERSDENGPPPPDGQGAERSEHR